MRRSIYFIICVSFFISCKDVKKGFVEGYQNAQNAAEEEQAVKKANAPVLYAFDGGTVYANDKNLFAQGNTYKGEKITLSDGFYVVKHPDGVLLWDTGLPEDLVGKDSFTTPDGGFTLSRKDSILEQLALINVRPEDVKYIAFSHIHFDHTGGARYFKNAMWLVQQTTLDFIDSDDIKGNSFYDVTSFSNLTNKKVLTGDHDVFGDGTVIIKYLPGHTAGHQALFVDLATAGPTMLTGDTYHFNENRNNKIVPQINYDIPASETSIVNFENFVKEKKAAVYIQHDMEDFNAITKAPIAIE